MFSPFVFSKNIDGAHNVNTKIKLCFSPYIQGILSSNPFRINNKLLGNWVVFRKRNLFEQT